MRQTLFSYAYFLCVFVDDFRELGKDLHLAGDHSFLYTVRLTFRVRIGFLQPVCLFTGAEKDRFVFQSGSDRQDAEIRIFALGERIKRVLKDLCPVSVGLDLRYIRSSREPPSSSVTEKSSSEN